MEERTLINCACCGSRDYKIVYPFLSDISQKVDAIFSSSSRSFCHEQVVQCTHCELIYVNPRLAEEIVYKGYEGGEDLDYISQAGARMATFEHSMDLIRYFRRNQVPGRILDIGAAGGFFLHIAKSRGWDVVGIEPNKWLAGYAHQEFGIPVTSEKLEHLNYPKNSFDVITLWDVLEHTHQPHLVIQQVRKLLKEDGLLVVSYPDIGSLSARLLKRRWWFLLDVHLYYFTKKTIADLLTNNGFEILGYRPLFQKLSLGYLAKRLEAYSAGVGKLVGSFFNKTHLSKKFLTYLAGQKIVFCKPKDIS